jgi:hypothetical protein
VRKLFVGACITISLGVQGCGIFGPMTRSETKLNHISIGDQRKDVLSSIGNPNVVRGSGHLPDGHVIQVDEYRLFSKYAGLYDALLGPFVLTLPWWMPFAGWNDYWLQYVDGKLDHWGRAGDWQPNITGDFTIRQK